MDYYKQTQREQKIAQCLVPLDTHLKQAKLTDKQYKSDQQLSLCERQRAPTGVTEVFSTLI